MRIEIWAEVTCPWCGLGNHRLNRAVEQFEHGDEVEVIHRSFPLSDGFPTDRTIGVREALRHKHGMTGEQLETMTRRIEAIADQEGLSPYIVLNNQVGNTQLAHEFLAYASDEGKNRAAWDAIFQAYFGAARPIFGLDVLLELAEKLGLERAQTRRALSERRFQQQVHDEARDARRLGATGAPFIVLDGRYALSGAQDTATLLDVLHKLWNETQPSISETGGDAAICGPGSCAAPAGQPNNA
ncbi:DsbA family oxidoreductase [Nocardia pseudovaccinii]|uniref:DsbA family oxidoreductase n=1 Tax=Nocardia pseudovaccinii TaxID=189540 RepID=UPI0007A3CCE0|nr:DsbA family oxidoreductase [Nocardia pseudovaccinii]